MNPRAVITGLVLGTALVLTSCGTEEGTGTQPAAPDLAGKTYVGDAVTVDGSPYDVVPGSMIRLAFDEARISAAAGCNTMSGAATWGDGTLMIDGPLASTEMGCDPALMDQDTWLMEVLTAEPTLAATGDTLTLTSGATVITLTDEEVAVPDASLTGTVWQLDAITEGASVSSVPAGVTADIAFDAKGTLHANLGCNIGNGSYTVEGDTLQIGPLATTRKACEGAASDVESAMLSVLDGPVTYTIDGSQLTLSPSDGGSATELGFRSGMIQQG
jgi:heat shock protein HslJ